MAADKIKEVYRPEMEDLGFEMFTMTDFFENISMEERARLHRIKFYSFLFVTEGKGMHLVDFENYKLSKGSLIFTRKDVVHAWLDSKDLEGYVMIFTEDFFSYNRIKFNDLSFYYPYSALFKPTLNISDCENCQTFYSLMDSLYLEFTASNTREKKEILQSLVRALFLKIQAVPQIELEPSDEVAVETFAAFQHLLEKKLSKTRNAADYCKELNVSFRKLNDICKELTKKTLKIFIDDLIILKAKRYLFNGELSISEISYLLGFNEVTNFTKFFKRHVDVTPKTFRQNIISHT